MSPTVPHKIFISVVTGRVFCSTGVKNAPVYTGRIYGPYIRVLGTHYPYIRAVQTKSIANNAFLYGPYIRAVYTGDRDALPVHTARTYGPYVRVSKMHPYVRVVNTARIYGCSVHTTRIDELYS